MAAAPPISAAPQETPLDLWLPLPDLPEEVPDRGQLVHNVRLNSLCSLYYFSSVVLGRDRLIPTLHGPWCLTLQRQRLKLVLEWPRGHFKTTLCTESLPMWRTLKVHSDDIEALLRLGYSDDFCHYLLSIHNPDQCWLIASETHYNARNLMGRIKKHFENNHTFRSVFEDVLPKAVFDQPSRYDGKWSDDAFSVNRDDRRRGESTFECIGVGGAVQSRHFDGGIIEDDLVGRKATDSDIEMQKVIEWHQLLAGVFENVDPKFEGNEVVVSNRWSYADLNSWVREHEPWFEFQSRAALECPHCGHGTRITEFSLEEARCSCGRLAQPIFPEQFSIEKLYRTKTKQGGRFWSAQYMNRPAPSEDADFREEWLRHFDIAKERRGDGTEVTKIKHLPPANHMKDISIGHLYRIILVDPNHFGATGTARQAIVATGVSETNHKYLLDVWAKIATHQRLIDEIFHLAEKWRIRNVYVEDYAGQEFLVLELRSQAELRGKDIHVEGLRGGGHNLSPRKEARIKALQPLFENGEIFVRPDQLHFLEEYLTFPKGRYVDILDALSYGLAVWRRPMSMLERANLRNYNDRMTQARSVRTGY